MCPYIFPYFKPDKIFFLNWLRKMEITNKNEIKNKISANNLTTHTTEKNTSSAIVEPLINGSKSTDPYKFSAA